MNLPEAPLRSRLKSVRQRLGLSQQELAKSAGVTRQTIGGIEAGLYAPSATVALRLARALACRVEDLFWLDEGHPPVEAVPAQDAPVGGEARWTLARVGPRWVAHPLAGEEAFRTEMTPSDAVGTWDGEAGTVCLEALDDPRAFEPTVVLAACTPVLSLWARAAERWHPGLRVHWRFRNSTAAVEALARGEVHAAGLHFSDAGGEGNAALVRRLLPETPVSLIHLGVWEEGLLLAPGNPLGIRSVVDLARPGVRLVNREVGAGARHLLEGSLRSVGVEPAEVSGWSETVGSHQEVARAVRSGGADAGVSSAAMAAAYGLAFLPLAEVRYDLAVVREYLEQEPVRQLLGTLDNRWVRTQLSVLGGYNTARTGEVVEEVLVG